MRAIAYTFVDFYKGNRNFIFCYLIFVFMNLQPKVFETEIAGKPLKVELGRMAQQCSASCTLTYGETTVLGTTSIDAEPRQGIDFVPLMVNYQERMYAAGKIKGSRFIKREGRPSDDGILVQRIIDRGIRPMFMDGWNHETQIMCTVLSFDNQNNPDIVSCLAGSLSVALSEAPFAGPIASVRVTYIDGEFVINPFESQMENSVLDLIVTTAKNDVVMIEAKANEVPEDIMYKAIMEGKKAGQEIVAFFENIVKEMGKEKYEIHKEILPENMYTKLFDMSKEAFWDALQVQGKKERMQKVKGIKESQKAAFLETLTPEEQEQYDKLVASALDKIWKGIVRENILQYKKRIGGRGLSQIRSMTCDVDILPRVHGSGLFTRGETQCLSVVTVGSPGDAQVVDDMEEEYQKRYMHHYNFPPFSVGEVSFRLGTGNREIGHGALAERAIEPMLPSKADFPYTLRVVSEILSSNGSSSMAATCGSSLALMAAGVPLKNPVSGIAMGLMMDSDGSYEILTDLQDEEDFGGDMDFKVAGTKNGITAIQMDIKVQGLPDSVFDEALNQAYKGRMEVMEAMMQTISSSRDELSPYAPRITSIPIDPDMIRTLIGRGGETINKIIDETGTNIDIEQEGLVMITANNSESMQQAKKMVKEVTYKPKVGDEVSGTVTRITDFGAFLEVSPGREGLLHISNIAHERTKKVVDVLETGDAVPVKIIDIDKDGRIALSRKALIKKPKEEEEKLGEK